MKNITITFILARTKSNYEDIHKTGVYKIYHINKPNIFYIGSASSLKKWGEGFKQRWVAHVKQLKNSYHHSPFFQRVVNKYGIDGLRFEIIENCVPENCIEREQYWLDYYKPFKTKGYNTCKIAGNSLGYKMPEDRILNRRKIYQYTLRGEFIQEYKSLTEAAKLTKTGINEIKQCAKLRIKYSNGFIWRYTKEYVESVFNIKIFEIACYYYGEFKFKNTLCEVEKKTKVNKNFIYDSINKNIVKTISGWLFRKYDVENCQSTINFIKMPKYKYELIENDISTFYNKIKDLTTYLNVHRKYFEKQFKTQKEIQFKNKLIKKIEI